MSLVSIYNMIVHNLPRFDVHAQTVTRPFSISFSVVGNRASIHVS